MIDIIAFTGLIFVATSLGFLTNLSWGCFTFGCGLILFSFVSLLVEKIGE